LLLFVSDITGSETKKEWTRLVPMTSLLLVRVGVTMDCYKQILQGNCGEEFD